MCYPVTCPRCGKTGWEGCGNHVDQVMATVPQSERCTCAPTPSPSPSPFTLPLFRRAGRSRRLAAE